MYVDNRGALASLRRYNARRREPRYVASIPLTLLRFLRFGPVSTRGLTLDVSSCGISALICGAPRVGETVVIELRLGGVSHELLAMVRHSSDARSGFEFYPMSPSTHQALHDWIAELRRSEETLFPHAYARQIRMD